MRPMIQPQPDDGRTEAERFADAVRTVMRAPKTEVDKLMTKDKKLREKTVKRGK